MISVNGIDKGIPRATASFRSLVLETNVVRNIIGQYRDFGFLRKYLSIFLSF
jgi:hypothetical protein